MLGLSRSAPLSASSSCRLRSFASCEKPRCSRCCNAQARRHPLSLPASDRRAVWQDRWQRFSHHCSFLFCSTAAHSHLCHSPRIRQIVSPPISERVTGKREPLDEIGVFESLPSPSLQTPLIPGATG